MPHGFMSEMFLLSVVTFSSLALLGEAMLATHLQSLDTDLDNQLCQSKTHTSTIIDIHESMDRGAELMDGLFKESLEDCIAGCCGTQSCDLALYKNEGLSKTGKNCYYVKCGIKENCVLVEHSSFTSILFMPRVHSSRPAVPTISTPSKAKNPTTPKSTSTSAVSPASTPPPSTPTSASKKTTTKATTTVMTTTTGMELVENSTEVSTNSTLDSNSSAVEGKGLSASGKDNVVQAPSNGDKKDSKSSDACGEYGCDGSGVVAVVVVAVICFAIVLVVVAIMLKKAVDERRKRKFRNVDYLINGMYT